MSNSLRQLSALLQSGKLTSTQLTETALQKAADSNAVFTFIDEQSIQEASRIDAAIKAGKSGPLAGIPISLKDLFNVRGQPTFAGSKVLQNEASAETEDAPVIEALRKAGLIFVGRTNMSEFAFSGMGLNPHYGTPLCIWDRETGRIPGGSSSGSAVSVAEGIVPATMGSDTAGSCRIPAAFNGIVGVKPSYGRFSLDGIFPLSPTSDAPGPLAVDLDSCFLMDQALLGKITASEPLPSIESRDPKSITLAIPQGIVMQDLDSEVAAAFARGVEVLKTAGIKIVEKEMPVLDDCVEMFMTRAVALYESWQAHKHRIESRGDEYDPFVSLRMQGGTQVSQQEQQARYDYKKTLVSRFESEMKSNQLDGLIYPTTCCLPPVIPEDRSVENLVKINFPCLRNTSTANYFDGCSISLPCHTPSEAPVGFMVSSVNGDDMSLYQVASVIEQLLSDVR